MKNTSKAVINSLPGNHPKVKQAAVKFLKKTGRAVLDEILSGITTGTFVHYVNEGTKWFTGLYTHSNATYESFMEA